MRQNVSTLPFSKEQLFEESILMHTDKLGSDIFLEQVQTEKTNFIMSFEELGLQDPFTNRSKTKTENVVNQLSMNKNVYPDKIMEGPKPPKCIFVLDKPLMRKLVKLQLQHIT